MKNIFPEQETSWILGIPKLKTWWFLKRSIINLPRSSFIRVKILREVQQWRIIYIMVRILIWNSCFVSFYVEVNKSTHINNKRSIISECTHFVSFIPIVFLGIDNKFVTLSCTMVVYETNKLKQNYVKT